MKKFLICALFIAVVLAQAPPPMPTNYQTDFIHRVSSEGTGPLTVNGHVWVDDTHNRTRVNFNQTGISGYTISVSNKTSVSVWSVVTIAGRSVCTFRVEPLPTPDEDCTTPVYQGTRIVNSVRVNVWTSNCTAAGVEYMVQDMWTTSSPPVPYETILSAEGYYSETDWLNVSLGTGDSDPSVFVPPSNCRSDLPRSSFRAPPALARVLRFSRLGK